MFWPIDQLLLLKTNKITEVTVANSLPAWLPIDQLFCKFENIGGMTPPCLQSAYPWLEAENVAENTFTKIDEAD